MLAFALPTLVLTLDRCNNPNPSCSSCTSNQMCFEAPDYNYEDDGGGLLRRDIEYECKNYEAGYHCCNNGDCASGSSCESNICKDAHIVNKGCTQDYECSGRGGYCCAKTGLCGGANSCI